jgi:UDP-N-acetylglucosamine acyltransferase
MIHPTAIIDPSATIADDAHIGPYAIIGADVEIGSGTRVGAHTTIYGPCRIGKDNRIFQHASLGDNAQNIDFKNEATQLVIGDRNVIREYVSLNRGTVKGGGTTRVGDDNYLMSYVHIGHDCQIGSHNIFPTRLHWLVM